MVDESGVLPVDTNTPYTPNIGFKILENVYEIVCESRMMYGV
jgi:hypothetical protein